MSSLVAMVQVSLRRSRAAWPIVASAGLICLLAASLLAAGPMYAGAVSIAGLQRVMVDAPVAEANIEVSVNRQALDGLVTSERFATYGPFFTTADRFRDSAVSGRAEFTTRRSSTSPTG